MPDWAIDILKIIVSGLLIAIVTSILTVHLAIRRFYKEKWWEKKHEAYSNLLKALHHLKNYAAEHYEGSVNPRYITDEKKDELTKDWKKFSREFELSRDLASFQLSNEAVAILDEYEREKVEVEKSRSMFELIKGDLDAVTNCLEKIKKEAKRDLKVK